MERRTEIFRRVPPGDNWRLIDDPDQERTHGSLTDAIEYYFQLHGIRQYFIDAAVGKIYVFETFDDEPTPTPKYSIYGEYE